MTSTRGRRPLLWRHLMPYVYCVPATITEFVHGLDNKVVGKIDVEGRELEFATRKHVVLATNRHYSKCAWKPRLGSSVLIDGDLGKGMMLVDHIEADLMADLPVRDPMLAEIATKFAAMPNATKTLRHWKPSAPDAPARFRWVGEIPRGPDLDVEQSGILHAAYDPSTDAWNAWCVDSTTGRLAATGLPVGAVRLLARTFIGPEETKRRAPAPRPVQPAIPYEDCPF